MRDIIRYAAWLAIVVAMFLLIAQPVGHSARFNLSVIVIAILAVIMILKLDGFWRHVFLALASVVILQYAYWRTTSTLPPLEDLYSFIPGIILYAAEMYCILMLGISLFVVADPIERPRAPQLDEDESPTVDVYIPTYNEDREILALTVAAAKAMDYPSDKFTVYLLDDGGTDQKRNSDDPVSAAKAKERAAILKDLCSDLGAVYMTRAENAHAKAGNLNAALWRTHADLVVVFDADHAPERSFLRETVGYFSEDERLFLVQTPHFFSNPDPIERNLGTFGRMPSENEMFYGKIQKGLDRWNASFFCGSAAVLRREALEEVGGFSGITITEDCETALELHARGWNSLYIDKPLISGLQPETFASFVGQRSRWCQGMVQILMLKNPLFKRGLSLPQRLSYISSSLFWFFPFVRSVFFVAPLLFILFDMKIFVASFEDFFAYTVMYLIVGEMVRTYLYGSVRWPWISELYEYVQSVYLFQAIVSVLLKPKSPTFKVTDKGVSLKQDRLSELSLPYFIIFGILCFTLFVAAYRYNTEPEISSLLLIVGAWNWMNLMIAGCALGVVTERSQDLAGVELPLRTTVELQFGETVLRGAVTEASARGAKLIPAQGSSRMLRKGEYGRLQLLSVSSNLLVTSLPVSIVGGSPDEDGAIALRFDAEPHHFPIIAELLMHDMSVVREQRALRQRPKSMIAGSLRILRWAITCPLAAIGVALGGKPDDKAEPQRLKPLAGAALAAAPIRHREAGE